MKAKPVMLDQIEAEALRDSLIVEANALRSKLALPKLAIAFTDVIEAVEHLETHVCNLKAQVAAKSISGNRVVTGGSCGSHVEPTAVPRPSPPAKLTVTEQCRLANAQKASAKNLNR